MDAIAPAALALSVSFDAVATLGLVLMSFEGPFFKAMFPGTDDTHVNIAAGLGDILILTVVRGCLVMLPILGTAAAASWLGIAVSAVTNAAMTAWLTAKAVLALQLADGRRFLVEDTGVKLHLPTLLAAELLGAFMSWFLFALVWINRSIMQQPAASTSAVALARSAALQQLRQRLAVQEWVVSQEPEGMGPELTAPLLVPPAPVTAGGAAAPAGTSSAAAAVGEWDEEEAVGSFVSAHSRQSKTGSWVSAASQQSEL